MYFPEKLQSVVDIVLHPSAMTRIQRMNIERLGVSVGLKRNEILAATNLPIDNMESVSRGKVTFFSVLVSIIVVVCISFGLALLMNHFNFFDPTPSFTYTPGTRYGSINPADFVNST
jgi:hypothetical protein